MSHHHDHASPQDSATLSVAEKIEKMLDHWIHHNEEHAAAYEDWAGKAEAAGIPDVAALLRLAAEKTRTANAPFSAARALLTKTA